MLCVQMKKLSDQRAASKLPSDKQMPTDVADSDRLESIGHVCVPTTIWKCIQRRRPWIPSKISFQHALCHCRAHSQ